MRTTPVQAAFTTGEISPRLQARVDLDAYYTGAAVLENFVCLPHGPLLRRQGTTFISKAGSLDVRLIPFRFSVTQSLVIELGNLYARFYFQGGQVMAADGLTPYQITTPWTISQVHELDYAQSGDLLYVVHPNVQPQKFARTANNNWSIAPVTFTDKPEDWAGTNWPAHIVFFEQRLYYAATPDKPQTVWASRVGLFDEFTKKDTAGEVVDDMAIEYTIASDEVNGIQWLKAVNILTTGTAGAEYRITASSYTESLTPKNIRISRQTSYGSKAVKPQQIGNGVVFVQRGGTRMRMFEYQYVDDQYVAVDLTIMSEHILASGVKDMALQTVKDSYVWCVMNDGSIVGLSYEKQQKVTAWHKHTLANGGKAKSLAIIPGAEADEVWLAVEREINGTTKLYIELFDDAFSELDSVENGRFLDSHLTLNGTTAVSTVSGLSHLEGQEVSILVDGWVHPNQTVSNGTVTLQSPGKHICVGLQYLSEFVSCQIQAQDAVTLGYQKRIYSAEISFLKSLGFSYGVAGGIDQEYYMGPTHIMNKATPLFTGTLSAKVPSSSSKEQQVFVRQDLPLPCEIRAIKYDMEVNQ